MIHRFLLSTAPVLLATSLSAQSGERLTLEDIYNSDKFEEETLEQPQWIPGTQAFTFLRSDSTDGPYSIYRHDAATGDETMFLDGENLLVPGTAIPLEIESYTWGEDGSKMLLETNTEEVWRHSTRADFYVYDTDRQTLSPVSQGEKSIENTVISPDGAKVGYVSESNIFILDLNSGETEPLTEDGSETVVNGCFDWVYEEEFGICQGWQWSPDSRKVAFWRLDKSAEPEFSWLDYNPLHQELTTICYPKVGERNAVVMIGVVDVGSGETVWMDIGEETDIYIPRIQWTADPNRLSIQRLNRAQNRLELLSADVSTGETRTLLTDTDPCWIEVHDNLFFLEDGSGRFIWTSERDGFNHIYLYRTDGTLERQLTEGDWEVNKVIGVDEARGVVYFTSGLEDIINRYIYSVGLNGSDPVRITNLPGRHQALFSGDFSYFLDTWSDSRTPTRVRLLDANGNHLCTLVENDMALLDQYDLTYPEFLSITTSDGFDLNAFMLKPVDFDSTRQYPVLVHGYGGPWGQMVSNKWRKKTLLWYNLLAQNGYLVFCVDNRGVGGRGKAMANLAYRNLARWAIHDQIEGAKYLAGLPYVDSSRIGIYGWSFGGYLSLLAMTVGSEHFSTGVAGAPVTCWTLYDAIYTERYMGTPEDNRAGYDSAAVFTYLDRLKGDLLIIHGTADDNVHTQNSMQLIEQLQMAGKQFDVMIYPGEAHSPSADDDDDLTELHLHQLITEYLLEHL